MGYPQFVDAAAMTGLLLFGLPSLRPPYPGAPPVKPSRLEEQLDLFFTHLTGLKRHLGSTAPGGQGAQKAGPGQQPFGSSPGRDPYKEWWDLAGPQGQGFKEAGSAKAWAPNSTLALKPVLIQVGGGRQQHGTRNSLGEQETRQEEVLGDCGCETLRHAPAPACSSSPLVAGDGRATSTLPPSCGCPAGGGSAAAQ